MQRLDMSADYMLIRCDGQKVQFALQQSILPTLPLHMHENVNSSTVLNNIYTERSMFYHSQSKEY